MSLRRCAARLFFVLALGTAACSVLPRAANRQDVTGSGTLATETRAVTGFTELELAGIGDVEVVFGDSESLVIEAEDNLLPYLTTTVRGGQLVIGTKDNANLLPTLPVHYVLTVKQLETAQLSGSGNINFSPLSAERLALVLLGSGNLTASGVVSTLEARLEGSGNIECGELQAASVGASLPGSGNIVVWATDRLSIRLGGSGSVSYYGQPADLDQDVSGPGSVHALGDK